MKVTVYDKDDRVISFYPNADWLNINGNKLLEVTENDDGDNYNRSEWAKVTIVRSAFLNDKANDIIDKLQEFLDELKEDQDE